MSSDDTTGSTRRDTLKYGGAVAAGGLLAGCAGGAGETTPTGSGEYSVTMAPMGEVTVDGVPETAAVYDAVWADHLVALGQQERIVSLGWPDRYYTGYYDQLPGVSFDTSDLPSMWSDGLPRELFYELDADVHHLDPCRWLSFDSGWNRADFDEIEDNVGPFFANRFSRAHSDPPEGECTENYDYYSVWELAEKFSQVYRVQNRGEQLRTVREEMVADIEGRLPPESERPTVALVVYNPDNETFGTYEINGPGFAKAHYRPLEPVGAFADSDQTYANDYSDVDLEQMLEVDPADRGVLLCRLVGNRDPLELEVLLEAACSGLPIEALFLDRPQTHAHRQLRFHAPRVVHRTTTAFPELLRMMATDTALETTSLVFLLLHMKVDDEHPVLGPPRRHDHAHPAPQKSAR